MNVEQFLFQKVFLMIELKRKFLSSFCHYLYIAPSPKNMSYNIFFLFLFLYKVSTEFESELHIPYRDIIIILDNHTWS